MGIIDNSRIKIEIDGIEFSVKRGSKIIEIADEAGIYIPRFCYHKKLSIAANCRMCLVEVEKAPKLFPACATPVNDGMKIFTNTEKVISAQRAVMEFLLVNHPLDCPICDQGGECELQDLTVGYGCSTSRFLEDKRVFDDYDLGPLVSTDVTRCILCSRCVRFCSEISGTDDLGIINRGSNSRIFTFLKSCLHSGLSGNVIDLCPVGSLTAKPSKFKVRPWELVQKTTVGCHDCVGSNLYIHIARDKIIRVVPKRNELLNETWISDRDRFSYEGLYSSDRLKMPMVKYNGVWKNTSWAEAFKVVLDKFSSIKTENFSKQVAAIASPNSTCEEFFLLQKLLRFLGSDNVDHRLNQVDFSNQDNMPAFVGANIGLNEFDELDSVLLIGSDIVREQPIISIKLRKILNSGGSVFVLNPMDFNFFMNVSYKKIVNPGEFIHILSCIIKNILLFKGIGSYDGVDLGVFSGVVGYDKYTDLSRRFLDAKRKVILIGQYVTFGPDYSKILSLCNLLSKLTESFFGVMTEGSNSAGGWLSGFVPHRLPGGIKLSNNKETNCLNIFSSLLKIYVLFGVEIENDSFFSKNAVDSLLKADFVLSFASFKSDILLDVSTVILPISCSYENSGTFVNMSGVWQTFDYVVLPDHEVKFGWKALIDLANYLKVSGFSYSDYEQVLLDLKSIVGDECFLYWDFYCVDNLISNVSNKFIMIPYISQYASDSLVRRAGSLQRINDDNIGNLDYVVTCNEITYNKLNMSESVSLLNDGNIKKRLMVHIDASVSDNVLFIIDNSSFGHINFYFPYDLFSFDKI